VVIQQPFKVTITVQPCGPLHPTTTTTTTTARRYFVQAALINRAPFSASLTSCHLNLPKTYSLISEASQHLRNASLSPGQEVRYSFLVERTSSSSGGGGGGGGGGSPTARELRSKLGLVVDYTWDDVMGTCRRIRKHYPPQEHLFERWVVVVVVVVVIGGGGRTYGGGCDGGKRCP